MDLASVIGLIVAFAGVVGGFTLEGGGLGSLLQLTAAMIVLGGTIGVVVVCFPMDDLKKAPGFIKLVFINKDINYLDTMETLVETADKARREGLLSLESQLSSIENKFLTRGLQLVIDGTDPELTRNMLEMEIEAFQHDQKTGPEIFEKAGGFAPTLGIIGTVMGMVNILGNLEDPSTLGESIAVAFIATLYGVGSANLIFLPWGSKLKIKVEAEVILMEMILEGILSIQAGENPRVIREKLMTFLPAEIKDELQAKEAAEGR